jgi:hypothetical protein
MQQQHPSPTARDGRIIEQSHYIKKSDTLDDIIQCAQCGFMVNLIHRPTGDSLGAIGNPTIKTSTFTPPGGASFTDTYGDPVDTNSGCPFCNSMNPKAKGRETDPFTFNTKNVENL